MRDIPYKPLITPSPPRSEVTVCFLGSHDCAPLSRIEGSGPDKSRFRHILARLILPIFHSSAYSEAGVVR